MQAGNPAMGLWIRAGSWSSQQLTDGYIPAEIARSLGNPAQLNSLVHSGLWIPSNEGYEFHQWDERNPTRKDVQDRRAVDAERLRKWRENRRAQREDDR